MISLATSKKPNFDPGVSWGPWLVGIYTTLLQILNVTQRVKERKTDSLNRDAREKISPG